MHKRGVIIHVVPLTKNYKMQKKLLIYKWDLFVSELFNIAVNYFDAKKLAHGSLLLIRGFRK